MRTCQKHWRVLAKAEEADVVQWVGHLEGGSPLGCCMVVWRTLGVFWIRLDIVLQQH